MIYLIEEYKYYHFHIQELLDNKYRSDSNIRELKSKLNLIEDDNARNKQDLSKLRENNTNLDSDQHEMEKNINQVHAPLYMHHCLPCNRRVFMG